MPCLDLYESAAGAEFQELGRAEGCRYHGIGCLPNPGEIAYLHPIGSTTGRVQDDDSAGGLI